MRISLIVLEGQREGERLQVNRLPAYLGSGDYSDVVLPARGVLESHARLSLSDNDLVLSSLSSGRLQVNDHEVERAVLRDGDIIELGELKMLLQFSGPAGAGKPESAGARNQSAPGGVRVWTAGFSERVREFFTQDLVLDTGIEAETFRTGEEVLTAFSKALAEDRPPDLLILDLKLPLINGVNVAIAARAFELGYYRPDRIPLAFLFAPPQSSGFEKVIKFCQPLTMASPENGGEDEIMNHLKKLVNQAIARKAEAS